MSNQIVLLTAQCSWLTAPLVNLAQQLAAHAFPARLATGHNAAWRGKDVNSHPAQHAWNLAAPHIHAASRARHTFHLRDGRLVVGAILQVNPDNLVALFFRRLEVGDISLFLQDAGNLHLQPRSWDIYLLVPGLECIPHSRQHVCDRIGQPHRLLLLEPPVRSASSGEPAAACSSLVRRVSFLVGIFTRRCERPTTSSQQRFTTTTSKPLEFPRATPVGGSTGGKCRTCARSRAAVRKTCSGDAGAW